MTMFLANLVGSDGLIVIVIALIVIFGGSQLPKIARNVGAAGKEFKRGQNDEAEQANAAAAAQAIAPPSPQVVDPAPAPDPDPDTVTVSKAELDALIQKRMSESQAQKDATAN